MTPDQTRIVQQTWKQVVPIADAAGELFYRRLFEIDPSTCERHAGATAQAPADAGGRRPRAREPRRAGIDG